MNEWDNILKKFQLSILDHPESHEPLDEIFEELFENETFAQLSVEYEIGYSRLCFIISAYLMAKSAEQLGIINYEKIKG